MNLRAVTHGLYPFGWTCPSGPFTIKVFNVSNSHFAFSPSGVLSAFQVRRAIVPSGDPVARTPMREYSRSRNARDVIAGYELGTVEESRSSETIGRPLMVWSQSFDREHEAT